MSLPRNFFEQKAAASVPKPAKGTATPAPSAFVKLLRAHAPSMASSGGTLLDRFRVVTIPPVGIAKRVMGRMIFRIQFNRLLILADRVVKSHKEKQ